MVISLLLFVDSIMHYVWNQNSPNYKEATYQQYIDKIKLTPRVWNSKTNLTRVLQHISWTLNLNINVIGLKRSRDHIKCNKHGVCFLSFYIFQNPLVKLLRSTNSNNNFNVLLLNKKYYLIPITTITPSLTNAPVSENIIVNNFQIIKDHILEILKSNPNLTFPININIYSSYKYINSKFTKSITQHPIGQYKCRANNTLHIFISPHLIDSFDMHIISNVKDIVLSQTNSLFTNPIKEGKCYNVKNTQPKVLNQEHCICEHSETRRVMIPSSNSFKPLASKQLQKFFLYENLKIFGFVTPAIDKKIQICSKLSIISFDTESLNKSLLPSHIDNVFDTEFINDFSSVHKKKISYGVQQLYTIGAY